MRGEVGKETPKMDLDVFRRIFMTSHKTLSVFKKGFKRVTSSSSSTEGRFRLGAGGANPGCPGGGGG